MKVEKKEVDEIVKAYNETGEEKSISMNGLYVAGVKYVVLKAEGRSIYARKVRSPCPRTRMLRPARSSRGRADQAPGSGGV